MKKLMLLLMVFVSITVLGEIPKINVDSFSQFLKEKDIRVLPIDKDILQKTGGYNGFYSDNDLQITYNQTSEGSYISKYESIVNKVFKIIDCLVYKDMFGYKIKIVLYNSENGIIYYDYDPEFSNFLNTFEIIQSKQKDK